MVNKKKHQLFMNYLKCKSKYKINYDDYIKMHFYELDELKRNEVLTPKENIKLINKLNPFDLRYQLVTKNEFNHRFDKFIKRDWLPLNDENNEEFRLFIKSREQIFVPATYNSKPNIIDINNSNEWQLHQELINTDHYIVEEIIKHHTKFNEITKDSLITFKFITLLNDNVVSLLGCYMDIKIKEDRFYIPVDIEKGTIYKKGIHNYNEVDMIGNYKIKSFKIPMWKKALKMVYELPFVIPDLKYVSFSIAITDNDVILISASDEADIYVLQHPIYLTNNDGMLKKINEIMGGIYEKNGI